MRDKADHEATAMMKAQFMSLWDGNECTFSVLQMTSNVNDCVNYLAWFANIKIKIKIST